MSRSQREKKGFGCWDCNRAKRGYDILFPTAELKADAKDECLANGYKCKKCHGGMLQVCWMKNHKCETCAMVINILQ